MKKWIIRGRFNKENANSDSSKHLKYKDGQYLYYGKTMFEDKRNATLFKTIGGAKGKMTIVKQDQEKKYEWQYYYYIKDIEIVEVEVVIPGDE